MKVFVVLSALVAVALAKPGFIHGGAIVAPLAYAHVVHQGAPIGADGRVVDTPEVVVAKAEHAAAHVNEKVSLANEAVKSADFVARVPALVSTYSSPVVVPAYGSPLAYSTYVSGAPVGVDGRVVDTPEVAHAKAEHAAAHVNEKVTLAHEAAKNHVVSATPVVVSAYTAPIVSGVYPAAHGLAYSKIVY